MYGDLRPKLCTPQPKWLDIFVNSDLCPKLWTPQLNWLDIFVYRDLCPKLWTPQPNWLDILMYGDLCPKLWTPLLDWRDVLVQDDFRLKKRVPQPNWHNVFTFRDRSKVVDLPAYALVVCLFLCSVTRICIQERFWSREVDNLCKHTSNSYIVICSNLLWWWTLHKFPHGQFIWVVDVKTLYPSTNSYWASYVDWCRVFGLVLARPSQNKLIWFSYAVLLFVVEWRQNVKLFIPSF